MTDFASLFRVLLPGIYRTKDAKGELQAFLAVMAAVPSELEASIEQLGRDIFVDSCRADFLPLIGGLIGADVDLSQPASAERAALATTFAFYRSKGLAVPLAEVVRTLTGWSVTAVDESQMVARMPFVDGLSVVVRQRERQLFETPAGSGFFAVDGSSPPLAVPLFDEALGRPIARDEIDTRAAALVGTDRGIALRVRGATLFGPSVLVPWTVKGADLSDFANPLTAGGAALTVGANEVAIDPLLGRFLTAPLAFAAADMRVDFHQRAPMPSSRGTLDLGDPARLATVGRSDDVAPYTLDLRGSSAPTDCVGRTHYDNHVLFLTPGRAVANVKPTLLFTSGSLTGWSLDTRPLASGDTVGVLLQLQDGLDGGALTRQRLAGQEAAFVDQPRGFTLRDGAVSLVASGRAVRAKVRAADLGDFTTPRDASGAPLTLNPADIAVDPQRGRLLLSAMGLALDLAQLRVGYNLAAVMSWLGQAPTLVAPGGNVYAFGRSADPQPLRDAFDGTALSAKLRLGATLADFHGSPRGYVLRRQGADVTASVAPTAAELDASSAIVPAGQVLIDVDRGRFALPPGFLGPTDVLTVDFGAESASVTEGVFARVSHRLSRMCPAGVTPVLVDTRRPKVNPANLLRG